MPDYADGYINDMLDRLQAIFIEAVNDAELPRVKQAPGLDEAYSVFPYIAAEWTGGQTSYMAEDIADPVDTVVLYLFTGKRTEGFDGKARRQLYEYVAVFRKHLTMRCADLTTESGTYTTPPAYTFPIAIQSFNAQAGVRRRGGDGSEQVYAAQFTIGIKLLEGNI